VRRARSLPWSDRAIVLASLALVVLLAPVWVDPVTLAELGGVTAPPGPARPSETVAGGPALGSFPSDRPSIGEGPATVVARDAFGRDVTDGWGQADLGGRYTLSGGSQELDVESGLGVVLLSDPGTARSAHLADVAISDADLTFTVSFDQLPNGGGLYIYGLLRRIGTGAVYRPKIFVMPDGVVYAHAGVRLSDGERSLGRPVRVADLSAVADRTIRVRTIATGRDPTTIRVKAWLSEEAEPDYWHFAVIDWTGSLQGTGSVGLAAYLGSRVSNPPVSLFFSDILVTTRDAPNTSSEVQP
jgi:hypothetical protein